MQEHCNSQRSEILKACEAGTRFEHPIDPLLLVYLWAKNSGIEAALPGGQVSG